MNGSGPFISDKLSPLEAAIVGGHETVFDKLLEASADIGLLRSTHNCTENTILCRAISGGYASIVEKLLALSAGDEGYGLGLAAQHGHKSIVEMLLKALPEINAPEQRYEGLVEAVIGGHEDIVAMLLKAGANPNGIYRRRRDYGGMRDYTPLQEAAKSGSETILEMLIKAGVDVNETQDKFKRDTALTLAADRGHTAVVSKLLKAGANPNVPMGGWDPGIGSPSLEVAIARGHKTIVEMLIKASANITSESR